MIIKRASIFVFFFLFLTVGLTVYGDYGISTDEPMQRMHGLVTLNYLFQRFFPGHAPIAIFENIPLLEPYQFKFHGVIFHLPALLIEIFAGLSEPSVWRFRHAYTFLWFFVATIFFYLLVSRRYGWKIAITACIFFILSPRIFAHSFYNVKDLAFLSAFTISIYFSVIFLEKTNVATALAMASSVAVAANIRLAGLLLPGIVCAIFFADALIGKKIDRKAWRGLFLLLLFTVALTIAFWPASWKDPVQLIWETLTLSMNYTKWDGTIIYLSDLVRGANLPWHYITVWFTITTPISYLLLFAMGVMRFIITLDTVKDIFLVKENREDLLYLAIIIIPSVSVVVFHSTLYGGWRHLCFIYSAFLMIGIKGFAWLLSTSLQNAENHTTRGNLLASVALGGLLVYQAYILLWMTQNHPYQFVYFNLLAGSDVSRSFDRDYWGVSAKAGLDYIVNNDNRKHIKVAGAHVANNVRILEENDRARIRAVSQADADYFVETYRNVRGESPRKSDGREVFFVSVDNFKIMSVFDLHAKPRDNAQERLQ